jgi:microcystin-dependent protein
MSDQYLGEIRIFGGNFAPLGWAVCDGQILPISQNSALFSLLGTNYGGNGTSNFALPNLQAHFPIGQGDGVGLTPRVVGETAGSATVTLTTQQMAGHSHVPQGSLSVGSTNSPSNAVWAQPHTGRVTDHVYATSGGLAPMAAGLLTTTGGDQPHNNLPPYLVLTFIIALQGIFPPRS